ncbi:MAG: glycosyltransferase [Candidatus Aminicenantes bacterium]|nr:glycosyltransferase [Candidatus Aminicenantes bacterium]
MMKILHIVGKMQVGGVETWLMHVLRHIDRRKYQMDFVVHATEPGFYDEEIRNLGSRLYPCLDYRHPFVYKKKLMQIFKEYGPFDIVHSHVFFYSGWVLRTAHQANIVGRIAHIHNDSPFLLKSRGFRYRLYSKLMRYFIRRHANLGIGVSQFALESFFGPNWSLDKRWNVLYCGIDLSPFYKKDKDRANIRHALGLDSCDIVVGHVGRFSYNDQKNHKFWIQIAREIHKRNPRIKFLLIGDGPLRKDIEEQVYRYKMKDKFIFAGIRSDVPDLMKGAMDVFLFPSKYEGLPLTIIEAQAAGLPIVMSDIITREVDVVPELIKRVSLNASPGYWAEVVLDLLDNRKSMPSPDEALCRVEKSSFNINKSVEGLLDFYDNLLKQA